MAVRDCETVEKFRDEALALFSVTVVYHTSLCPGDSITFRGETIRYTPKPAPPIGCMRDEHIDALKRDGRFVLNGETILYEAKPPPRDEARESYKAWARRFGGAACYISTEDAFLAGRASVKS